MTDKNNPSFGIFGFGNMGRAIFDLLKKNPDFKNYRLNICSPGVYKISGAKCVNSLRALGAKSDIIFLSIKPQDFHNLPAEKIGSSGTIVISIMAGIKISSIAKIANTKKIIRAMPNLNLQIGESMTGWHAGKKQFTGKELRTIETIFNAFGKQIFLKNENEINAITAVSGSGPAYVFLFMDALAKAAAKLGFSKTEALALARQTISGSLEYSKNENDLAGLIKKVASKKGATEAALKKLGVAGFYKKWEAAVKSAKKRTEKLSK